MVKVSLKEDVSAYCTGYDEGRKLFSLIDGMLSKGEDVTVDLAGVKFTSLSFFNGSVGELTVKYSLSILKDKLHFVNMSASDKSLLLKSIAFAKKVKQNPSFGKSTHPSVVSP